MKDCGCPETCLPKRELELRTDQNSPCQTCMIGTARQNMVFVPEPGFGPYCLMCGADKSRWSKNGLCWDCSRPDLWSRREGKPKPRKLVSAYWGYNNHEIRGEKV